MDRKVKEFLPDKDVIRQRFAHEKKMQQEKSYSVAEYAELHNVNRGTVYRWIKKGEIIARKEGGELRVLAKQPAEDGAPNAVASSVAALQQQLEEKDAQIKALLEHIAMLQESQREQNAIVMQMARNTEQTQKLLEDQKEPFYRNWLRRGKRRKSDTGAILE